MQQIESKENILWLKVFINGVPDLKMIPKEKAASMFTALELQISGQQSSQNTGHLFLR